MSADLDDQRFRALASPVRRRLLRLARDEARSVGDLVEMVGLSQPAVSQHLGELRSAGLVTVEVRGRMRLYRADVAAVSDVAAWFDDYWSGSLDRLAAAAGRRQGDREAAS